MPAATLFTQAFAPYLALGAGVAGTNAVARGWSEGLAAGAAWAACGSDRARLIATGLEHKFLFEPGPQASAELEAGLQALMEGRSAVLLLAAAAESAALDALPPLLGALQERKLPVCLLLEGAAPETLKPLPALTVELQPGVAPGHALLCAAHAWLGALASGSGLDEWQQALRGAGAIRGFAGTGDAAQAALDAALQASEAAAGSVHAAWTVTSGHETSLEAYRELCARVEACHGPAVLGAIGHDAALAGEAHALVLVRAARSANVLSLPRA